MATLFRKYNDRDQIKIFSFYKRLYEYNHLQYGILKVIWESMHKFPSFPLFHHDENGIWECGGNIVGMVRLTGPWFGEVSIEVDPEYTYLFEEMLDYAEYRFAGTNINGKRFVRTNIYKSLQGVDEILQKLHYEQCGQSRIFFLAVSEKYLDVDIPDGFRVERLSDVYNFNELNGLFWREFNYFGDPPNYDDDVYLPIKKAWADYDRENCTVILEQDGSYAGFCGLWIDEETEKAYIEPIVWKSSFKGLNLGFLLLKESVKNCLAKKVDTIYALPNEKMADFYSQFGFRKMDGQMEWVKTWEER